MELNDSPKVPAGPETPEETEKRLYWCRQHIRSGDRASFADMHARAVAARRHSEEVAARLHYRHGVAA